MNMMILSVAIGVGLALTGPPIRLDVEALLLQDLKDGRRPDRMLLGGQLAG